MAGGIAGGGGTTRRLIAGAVAAATLAAVLAVGAGRAGAYVNPFSQGDWSPGRIDMGVDMIPNHREPIRAIGAARILGSTSDSGWPGGRYLWYQLISGSHKGEIVYVAEHLRKLVPEGRRVDAGQRIATAIPGSPWIETGWANEYGATRASPCYREGDATHSGKTFARFLYRVGLPHVLDVDVQGSSHPTGKLC
jgi:murein DD-endopeptidase MepM/ murein hydrolase activator NlpD